MGCGATKAQRILALENEVQQSNSAVELVRKANDLLTQQMKTLRTELEEARDQESLDKRNYAETRMTLEVRRVEKEWQERLTNLRSEKDEIIAKMTREHEAALVAASKAGRLLGRGVGKAQDVGRMPALDVIVIEALEDLLEIEDLREGKTPRTWFPRGEVVTQALTGKYGPAIAHHFRSSQPPENPRHALLGLLQTIDSAVPTKTAVFERQVMVWRTSRQAGQSHEIIYYKLLGVDTPLSPNQAG
mmetsp:Transcript_21828/g.47489  ORF Transcript_21828/g.47489 Transcript_21828/m.47489 type:complete len:246 (-) Transcript_21828:118-855(-)